MTAGPYGEGTDESQRPDPVDTGSARVGWSRPRRNLALAAMLVLATVIVADANGELRSAEAGGRWLRTMGDDSSTTTTEPPSTTSSEGSSGNEDGGEGDGGDPRLLDPEATGAIAPDSGSVPTGTTSAITPTVTTTATTPATSRPSTTTPPVNPRPIPSTPPTTAAPAPPPPWADDTRTTAQGYVVTDVGCAANTSAGALNTFFRDRMGPVLGHDYQHVYPLGGDRYLWIFQDTFIDHPGVADELDEASFVHNSAMVQDGSCFSLYHRGSTTRPTSFESGTGEQPLTNWFWPMGGELVGGELHVFWAEHVKTANPPAGEGLGWAPIRTWLARYDTSTLGRAEFEAAPNDGVQPIYGYAVASDRRYTYLFGNTFDQNLAPEGGFMGGPHSATRMWLARVPRGELDDAPEYRTRRGWSRRASEARPILDRFQAENPMQPRFLDGHWVAATKVDGYWGNDLVIDVANDPWGPWTLADAAPLEPRGGDPLMNTYHAHLLPWLVDGRLVISTSQNAKDMARDAFPHPERYRLQFLVADLTEPPTTTTTTTTQEPTTTERPTTTKPRPTTSTRPPTTTIAPTTTRAPTTTVSPTTTIRPGTTTTPPALTTTTSSSSSTTSSTTAP